MKYMLPVVFVLLGGAMASSAFASTSVNVTNNVSTSTSTSSTGSNQTHVEIETNGVKKTFDSSGQDVHWQSDDGSSKVDINNNDGSTSVNQSQQGENHSSVSVDSDNADNTSTVTPQPSLTPKHDKSQYQQTNENTHHASPFSWLKDFFASFFKKDASSSQNKVHIFGLTFSF